MGPRLRGDDNAGSLLHIVFRGDERRWERAMERPWIRRCVVTGGGGYCKTETPQMRSRRWAWNEAAGMSAIPFRDCLAPANRNHRSHQDQTMWIW